MRSKLKVSRPFTGVVNKVFLGDILSFYIYKYNTKSYFAINKYYILGAKSALAVNGDGQDLAPGILNDTTVSDISADITVDSVKDHTL